MFLKLGEMDPQQDQFGGKAKNLSILSQHKIVIPRGFAVSYDEFLAFMEENHIPCDQDIIMQKNVMLQQQIEKGDFSKEMLKQWEQNLDHLSKETGAKAFVVRSSGSCEDSNSKESDVYGDSSQSSSMAGIYESYTNLKSVEEILAAVKACYASLYSDRAVAWMLKNHIDIEQQKMGLVVQEYIPGCPSGVMFTADTVEMNPDVLCINAVNDVCSSFVDGSMESVMIQMEKKTGAKIRKDGENAEESQENLLNPELLAQLSTTAVTIEEVFGCYQDIEWTVKDQQVVILQARPITTFYQHASFDLKWANKEDSQKMWFRVVDEPVLPLLKKIYEVEAESLSDGAFQAALRMEFYGNLMEQDGFYFGSAKELDEAALQHNAERYEGFVEVNSLLGKEVFIDIVLPELKHDIEHIRKEYQRELDGKQAASLLEDVKNYIQKCAFSHDLASKSAEMLLNKFTQYCKTIYPEITTEEMFDLVYSETIMSKDRKALIDMANRIQQSPVLSELFSNCRYDELLYCRLQTVREAKELLELMEDYRITYGIAGTNFDAKLTPTLYEKPELVIGKLRKLLASSQSTKLESQKELKLRQDLIEQKMIGYLPNDKEKMEFDRNLIEARKAFLSKDNHHIYMDAMPRGLLRLVVMKCCKLLKTQGIINNEKEVNYLTFDELQDLLITQEDQQIKELIRQRKAEFDRQTHMTVPEVIGECEGNGEGFFNGSFANAPGDQLVEMDGMSGLKKKAKGMAYLGVPETIEEDVILILPNGHDDIMNVLDHVKGLIFEGGAPYDHLGIIAREYQIPTLYYVSNVFQNVRPGDKIELDGIHGKLRIL